VRGSDSLGAAPNSSATIGEAPTNNAMLGGQIDGAGIKLKLTW